MLLMRRFKDQGVAPGSRIALVVNDALGNFAVTTPLAQALSRKYPGCPLDLWTGPMVMELAMASTRFERVHQLWDKEPRACALSATDAGPYDLVVNVESSAWAKSLAAVLAGESGLVAGPCVDSCGRADLPFPDDEVGRLWKDLDWTAQNFANSHACLESGFIAEVFCRAAYLDGPVPPYELPVEHPGVDVPDVLVSTSASLDSKLWPTAHWMTAVEALQSQGLSVGVVGAKLKKRKSPWAGVETESRLVDELGVTDLRGKLSLPQVVGALARAEAVLTLDNGILHLAAYSKTPVVGLFRHGIHRLWAPPRENLAVVEPGVGRRVSDISPGQVSAALNNLHIQRACF